MTPPAPPGGGLPLGRKLPSSQTSGQPRLEVTLSKPGKSQERLTITNHGPGDVYDLDFALADDRHGTREWREEGFPVPKLPAGKSVRTTRYLTMASSSPAYFTVVLNGPANEEAESQSRPPAYNCPLCGQSAADDSWNTPAQAELFERATMPVALKAVQDELESIFLRYEGIHVHART